jgi:RNA polymerase subunit RPABC4/transcription elongation factor Spt4
MNAVALDMLNCQNCGQMNADTGTFCRFCGTKLQAPQPVMQQQRQEPFNYEAPRPYAWKTDEYQTQTDARKRPGTGMPTQPGSLAYAPPYNMTGNYRCPNCMSQFLPVTERRISTAGWITFAVLLVFFFPLFWIGLLIKEDVHICPSCNARMR